MNDEPVRVETVAHRVADQRQIASPRKQAAPACVEPMPGIRVPKESAGRRLTDRQKLNQR
jgi:hypothetical protein